MSKSARNVAVPRRQRGVVLFIALIVLVAMTLAGLAMFRSVGTSVVIAGNLTFKQGATSAADRGIEAGRTWLTTQPPAVLQNTALPGFYSDWGQTFDPATFDWSGKGVLVTADDGGGNEIRYVVHRLCMTENASVNAPTQQCVTLSSSGFGGSKAGGAYGQLPLSNTIQAYFRITARAVGPKNTVSYVQSIIF
jgi:type IV pilus assembly protein PilX